jgi:hypothetical protein
MATDAKTRTVDVIMLVYDDKASSGLWPGFRMLRLPNREFWPVECSYRPSLPRRQPVNSMDVM